MYVPKPFEEPRREVLHALMAAHPLAAIVTWTRAGLEADHIPLLLYPAEGVLRGHVARANPLWTATPAEALAIFQGPDAYVSPTWYPSKEETGRAVPTWNYVVVHAHGTLRSYDDPAWVRGLLGDLTARHEARQAHPWSMADAPRDWLESRIAAVVGIELTITRLTGKWKLNQNQPPDNRQGVARGLRAEGSPEALAIASLLEDRP